MSFISDMYSKHQEAFLYIFFGGLTTLVTWASYAAFVWSGIELNTSNICVHRQQMVCFPK